MVSQPTPLANFSTVSCIIGRLLIASRLFMKPVTSLYSYPKYWAECYGTSPFLPMSRAEMDELGWDSCDIIIVTGDAYVDHPSFGMAVIGRALEAQAW